jgi:hypothetical protein
MSHFKIKNASIFFRIVNVFNMVMLFELTKQSTSMVAAVA